MPAPITMPTITLTVSQVESFAACVGSGAKSLLIECRPVGGEIPNPGNRSPSAGRPLGTAIPGRNTSEGAPGGSTNRARFAGKRANLRPCDDAVKVQLDFAVDHAAHALDQAMRLVVLLAAADDLVELHAVA